MSRSVFTTGGGHGIGLEVVQRQEGGKERAAVLCRTGSPRPGTLRLWSEGAGPAHPETVVFADRAMPGLAEAAAISADLIRHSLPLRIIHRAVAPMLFAGLGAACRVAERAGQGTIRLSGGRLAALSCTAGLLGFVWSLAREFDRGQGTVCTAAPDLTGTGRSDVRSQLSPSAVVIPFPARCPQPARARRKSRGPFTGAVMPMRGGAGMRP